MQRTLICLPDPVPADADIAGHCRDIGAMLAVPAPLGDAWPPATPAADLTRLAHPLAGHALERNGHPGFREGTTAREVQAALIHGASLVASIRRGDEAGVRRNMLDIAGLVRSDAVAFRRGAAVLAPDRKGGSIALPAAGGLDRWVQAAASWLSRCGDNPAWAATVMQAAWLNQHPLVDGNGRTSRVLFNGLLWGGNAGPGRYLPIYELRRHAPYTFEICLRRAELHGDWLPLVRLHRELLEVHQRHARCPC